MKLRNILITTALAAACLTPLVAAPQAEKDPNRPNTARFGDPTAVAQKYQDFVYGVIKDIKPDELVLTQTKFGADQAFKLTKKTKYTRDGKASSHKQLKIGDKIFIGVDKDKRTGDLIAKKVFSGVFIP